MSVSLSLPISQLNRGIFVAQTPTRIGSIPYNERLDFEVLVHLPPSSANSHPVYIPSLETNMPLFAHALSELQDAFYFGALSLKTSNMPVEAKVSTTSCSLHGSDTDIVLCHLGCLRGNHQCTDHKWPDTR